MFVKRLSLTDVRSFENASIELSNNINLITGHNNSGKSTILKAIYKMQDVKSIGAEDIRVHRDFAEIMIELEGITENDNKWHFNLRHPLAASQNGTTLQFKIQKANLEMTFMGENPDSHRKLFSGAGEEIIETDLRKFFGFSASEDQHNLIYPFFSKRKTSRYASQGPASTVYSVSDTFQNLPSKVQKVASQHVTKAHYLKWCQDILGFEVTAIPGEQNEYRLGIYSGYDSYIPLEGMGEGVANIIGLITILLTEDNRLFLIEELENDIHPVALKKLLNLIIEKSSKNQFFISTHSNIVLKYLASLPNSKIFYTEYDPIGNSSINIPTSTITEVSNFPQERIRILEMLGYDLFDNDLYAGYLILEESSAEEIIREFLIPLFVPELKHKIRTIAAQGATDLEPKFNDLHRLFLYLHM